MTFLYFWNTTSPHPKFNFQISLEKRSWIHLKYQPMKLFHSQASKNMLIFIRSIGNRTDLNGFLLMSESLVAQMVKCLPTRWETWVQSLGQKDLLEKEIATHSSILAWKIPWMEEPGRLQSMGSQSQTRLSNFTFIFNIPLYIYTPQIHLSVDI